METQKLLGHGRICVVADYRERETIGHLRNIGMHVSESSLEVGDFVCSERVVIERKAHSDFVSSIIDGRVFEQCRAMKENFERPVVIIEGSSVRDIGENALRAATASLITDYGVSLLGTRDPMDTAKTIYWIAKREQEDNKKSLAFKVGKKPVDGDKLKEFVLSSLPGVSEKSAKKILGEFGSLREFFGADITRMEKTIGKKRAEKIFNLVNGMQAKA